MGGVQMMHIDAVAAAPLPADATAEVLALFEQHGAALYRFSRSRARRRLRWLPWRAELDTRTAAGDDEPRDLARARTAFRRLSPRDRLLLSLRAQGLSYRDIGVAAGIRASSVGRLLARAVDRAKRELDRAGA